MESAIRLLGVLPKDKPVDAGTAGMIAGISIVLVLAIIVVILLVAALGSKCANAGEAKAHIQPSPQNKLLDEDKDAVVASLVATIEFNKETGKNAELKKIERID